MQYIVGLKLKGKSGHISVPAEDALSAALKAKSQAPDSTILYVRRQNKRGDARRPNDAAVAAL
jgi:hypothetical protein